MIHTLPPNCFQYAPEQIDAIQAQWNQLMSMAMWSKINSDKIGKLTRMRKRLLELGESIQSFFSDKDWIAQPRQQLKSALGSSIKLRDSLTAFLASAEFINTGADVAAFLNASKALEQTLMELMIEKENIWATALDNLGYDD